MSGGDKTEKNKNLSRNLVDEIIYKKLREVADKFHLKLIFSLFSV